MKTTTTPEFRAFRLSIEARDAVPFAEAMKHAGFDVSDTGERITTDDGLEAEQVVLLRVPKSVTLTPVDRVHALLTP